MEFLDRKAEIARWRNAHGWAEGAVDLDFEGVGDRAKLACEVGHLGWTNHAWESAPTVGGLTVQGAWDRVSARNGTTGKVFEPLDFLGKLSALVPWPRTNTIRFHDFCAAVNSQRSRA